MLKQNDKDFLRFLEINKSITLQQASILFYKDQYKSASRRLKQLEQLGKFKSYISEYNRQKAYYDKRPLSSHDLIVLDVYAELVKLGAVINKFKGCFQYNNKLAYLNGFVKPDGFIEFDYKDKNDGEIYTYYLFIEVDYYHKTEKDKFILYEKMYRDGIMKEECQGCFPTILVLSDTEPDFKYKSEVIDIVYGDMDLVKFPIKNLL